MSESDDDVPLGQRTAATAPQISRDSSKSVHNPDAQPAEAAPRARKPPIIDDSDDDDDPPIQKPGAVLALDHGAHACHVSVMAV